VHLVIPDPAGPEQTVAAEDASNLENSPSSKKGHRLPWPRGARRPRWDRGLHGGLAQLWTWDVGDDGWVYVFSTGFQRDKPLILRRVPADRIADRGSHEQKGVPDPWRVLAADCLGLPGPMSARTTTVTTIGIARKKNSFISCRPPGSRCIRL
jgi:hypothetical protein